MTPAEVKALEDAIHALRIKGEYHEALELEIQIIQADKEDR